MLSRLSYANVIATVALFLALGGSSYAALNLPKASVGPKQLQKNSVSSMKVKPGSLLNSDFKKSALEACAALGAAGPRGPGPQGVRGPGPPGATNVIVRHSDFTTIAAGHDRHAPVDCFPGEVATGGGIEITNGHTRDMMAGVSRPRRRGRHAHGLVHARVQHRSVTGTTWATSRSAPSSSAPHPDAGSAAPGRIASRSWSGRTTP